MRCFHRSLVVLSALGMAACAAKPPAEPAPAPQEQPRFEPRLGLGPRSSQPPIILRGPKSVQVQRNQEPLYVVDGVVQERAPEHLVDEPDAIESIDVLKGEAAVARYGSRGANGVIVITTKQKGST